MTRTPWGEADQLRERMLGSGPRPGAEAAERNQRERLSGAMVAVCAERGYEATRVSDLVALSGVSRRDFYRHFADKEACFLATEEAILELGIDSIALRYDGKGSALGAVVELIVEQPAAAGLCFVEVYAAGPSAVARMEGAVGQVEALYGQAFAAQEDARAMPREISRAIVGGLRKVIYTRLRAGREHELLGLAPQLWSWSFGYEAPPEPLSRPRQSPGAAGRYRPDDPVQRMLEAATRAVATRGFAATTIGDIVAGAGVSLSTFYAHFDSKEAAVEAALDAGQAQLFALCLPAFRRARGWPEAVRGAFEAMLAFFAAEPAFARLGLVEIYGLGAAALDRRDRTIEALHGFLGPGFERSPDTPPIAAEAIGGATYALIYHRIRESGTQSLPSLAPTLTYVALAPFLGAAEARLVANGRRGG